MILRDLVESSTKKRAAPALEDEPGLPPTFRRLRICANTGLEEDLLIDEVKGWNLIDEVKGWNLERTRREIETRDAQNRCVLTAALEQRMFRLASVLFDLGANNILEPRSRIPLHTDENIPNRSADAPLVQTWLLRARGSNVHPGLVTFLKKAVAYWHERDPTAIASVLNALWQDTNRPFFYHLLNTKVNTAIPALIALDGGANPVCETPSNCRFSALTLAILYGFHTLAEAMLAHGSKIDDIAYKTKGQTLLMMALHRPEGRTHLIQWLLAKGASVATRSVDGLTPLDYAAKAQIIDRPALVGLLRRGAVFEDPSNKDAKPTLAYALERERWATARELIDLGASLSRALSSGSILTISPSSSPCVNAAKYGHYRKYDPCNNAMKKSFFLKPNIKYCITFVVFLF